VLAHGIEERERAAAGADDEAEVALELHHVSRDPPVVRLVHLRPPDLEVRRGSGLPRLLGADSDLLQQLRVHVPGLGLHVHVAVEHDEASVLELRERVDLGQREVVAQEHLDQGEDDGGQPVEVAAGHAGGPHGLLGDARSGRQQRGHVGLRHVLRVLLGHLLDVDPAHVAEDDHRQLAAPVPGDAGVVLLRDRTLGLHEHALGALPAHLDGHDLVEERRGLVRRVGELHRARLHAATGQHLALQHHRAADLGGDAPRVAGRARQAAAAQGQPVPREQRLGFVLVEAHGASLLA
jgi:hypothetical protein